LNYFLEGRVKPKNIILLQSLLVAATLTLMPVAQGRAAAREVVSSENSPAVAPRQGRPAAPVRAAAPGHYRDGELLVKFKPAVSESAKRSKHLRHKTELLRDHKSLRMHKLRLSKGTSVAATLAAYRADPDVEYAEPNYIVTIQNTPNDPQFSKLWGLAKISAPSAWDISTGDGSPVVAILDTGIDYHHADLAANLWINQAELNGQPGTDNDGNGYLNDVYGYNAVDNNGDPRDDNAHGTHVAGIIGAAGNNALGVTGVAWDVRLLACKIADANGSGTIDDAIECLQYVKTLKQRGVNIVATNNSWGTSDYSQALYDAIQDQKDILLIATAGNDNSKAPHYPASYDLPNIISVAASDETDARAYFSNYGQWGVDIAAPGTNILSTHPGDTYTTLSGTSMATPYVSGLAALLKSQDASRTTPVLKNLILAGGDQLASFADLTATGRRINAYRSLSCTDSPLFAPMHLPTAPQAGLPQTLSALSINCGAAVGPVSVTLPGGGSIQLLDDGNAPDQVAGDGIFSGTWIPAAGASTALSFSSPLGSRTVASPPLVMGDLPALSVGAQQLPDSVTSASSDAPFSQSFPASGGMPPLSWSLTQGTLPYGLTLNSQTGEISGTTAAAGIFPITLQVMDSLGAKDTRQWTLLFNKGLRPGWPQELLYRSSWGSRSFAPIVADLDGDGKDEIIVSDIRVLYVISPDGSRKSVTLPGPVSTPTVADLDGDGQQEILVSVQEYLTDTNSIYAFHADLTPVAGFPAGGYPTYNGGPGDVSSPVVVDFNGDGQLKIAVVASPNNGHDPNFGKSFLILVDSAGQMASGWPQSFGRYDPFVFADVPPAVGDLYRDGKKELVLPNLDGFLRVFGEDGTLLKQWQFDPGCLRVSGAVLADMDGDGYLDVIVQYQNADNPNVIKVFDRNGTLLPGWPKILATSSLATLSSVDPIVADINGDGLLEIISVAGNLSNEVHVLSGYGSELAGWPVVLQVDTQGGVLRGTPVVADIDGDGKQEILFATSDFSYNGRLLALDPNGRMLAGFPKNSTPGASLLSGAAIGDLDGNGKLDLVVKSEDGSLWVWEMPQDGGGSPRQWPMFHNDPQHSNAWLGNLTPASFDFGTVWLGAASAAHPFSIGNPRPTPITVSSVSLSGIGSTQFSVAPGNCGSLPVTLPPRQSCSLAVTFSPTGTAVGIRYASLVVASSTPGVATAQASLSGLGVRPSYTLSYSQAGSGRGTVTRTGGSGSTTYSGPANEAFAPGTVVTLTPSSSSDTQFDGWTGCDSVTGSVCSVTLTSAKNVTGTFSLKTFTVTANITSGSGTITPAASTVGYGGSVTFAITPADGFYVSSCQENSSNYLSALAPGVGAARSLTLSNITANHTLSLAFAVPVPVSALAAGLHHSLVLLGDGTVWTWNGAASSYPPPTQVPGLTGITAIAAGDEFSVALKSDGTVWSWGDNSYSQLGDGSSTKRSVPVQAVGLSGAVKIAAGRYHAEALKSDGTVWAWGANGSGQLGDGSLTTRSTPVQVPGFTGVTAIAAGANHTVASKGDGTVWSWGYNGSGQLGDGTTLAHITPKQVPGLSGVQSVATGRDFSQALKNDGTVWGWGDNRFGQVGDAGSGANRVVPVQVTGLSSVVSLAAGASHTLAVLSDGTVWAWGDNFYGDLGDGSAIQRPLPILVPELSGITAAAAGAAQSMVLKGDNTVWTWGDFNYDQMYVVSSNRSTRSLVPGIGTPLMPVSSFVDGVPAIQSNATSAALRLGSSVAAYQYKLDADAYSAEIPVGTAITLSSLSPGTHILAVRGKDSAGNWQQTPSTVGWNVISEPPQATISGVPAGPTTATSAALEVSAPAIIAYKYKLDAAAYSAETPFRDRIYLYLLAEGVHTVSVLAQDFSGNWQVTPTTATWTVDLTPPVATISGLPASPSNSTSATLTVGGADVVSYYYSLDGVYHVATPVSTPLNLGPLGNGTHTVRIYGKDSAGNQQVNPTTANWVVDLIPPTASFSGTPGSPTNVVNATLTIGGADVVSYKYKLDTGGYSAETPVSIPISLGPLDEGYHRVSALGKDSAGNWQASPTLVEWTVDVTAPAATISGTPASPTKATGATLSVAGTGVYSYKYLLDTGAYSAATPVGTKITLSSLGDGPHSVSVLGKDLAGNWQATPTTATWSVDTSAPATSANPPGILLAGQKVALSCSDGSGSGCATTLYCLGTGCAPTTPYAGAIGIGAGGDLRFYSTDLAGNSETVKTASYTVLAADYAVNLGVAGSGAGTVESTPAGISTSTGSSARFAGGSLVTLHAAAAPFSLFTGWSGACGGTQDCLLGMTVNQSVTATFEPDTAHSTYIPGATGIYSPSIQSAYDAAADGDVIRLWAVNFTENILFAANKKVTISGGYDQAYTAQGGATVLHGKLTVTGGLLNLGRLVIR
jgi:alpha-tubulin suppressor-like RCC1 family protein/subtilisin family serine protease